MATAKLLLLVNYRPEYRHEWGQKTYYTQLRLEPLGQAETEELLTFLLGNDASLTSLKARILEEPKGPLLYGRGRADVGGRRCAPVGERGHYRLEKTPTELHISPTVQGVLAARIDRLSAAEKALLQQLAVIGRQFPVSLVKHVVSQTETELHRVLSSLQAKEFLYEQPAFPEVEYLFKHALTQEVTYSTVLHEQRKALHERTAQAMEACIRTGLTTTTASSRITTAERKCGESGRVSWPCRSAGGASVGQCGGDSSSEHCLRVLKTLPDTPARMQQEWFLQTTFGPAVMAAKGYEASEVEKAYTRALELCRQVGETPQLFLALGGLWQFYLVRAEYQKASKLAEQLLSLAQSEGDPTLLVEAHRAMGESLLNVGKLAPAQAHFEQALASYGSQPQRSRAFLSGFDPGVFCLSFGTLTLWSLGYPDQALKRSHEALSLARELSHLPSLAGALVFTAWLHQDRREGQRTQERVEAAMTLSTEQGFPHLGDIWDYDAGLCAGRARAGRGGDCPDAPRPSCPAYYRSRDKPDIFSRHAS